MTTLLFWTQKYSLFLWFYFIINFTKYNLFKVVVSCSGPFWKIISRFFFTTKYNTIVSIFYAFISIINYKKKFVLLYLIQFYTGFLSQSRHLQIEVCGWCGWFRHFESSDTKKNKKDYCSVCSCFRPELELNIFIDK